MTREDIVSLIAAIVAKSVAEAMLTMQTNVQDLLSIRDREILELKEENERLKCKLAAVEKQSDEAEQYSKQNNIILSGVPRTPNEDLAAIVHQIAAETGTKLEPWKLLAAH